MRVVLRNVCKDIKGARVLDNVNLELESGMVYGLRERTVLENHAYACYKWAYKSEG